MHYDKGNIYSPVSGSSAALMSGLASPVSPTNESALLDYFWRSESMTHGLPSSMSDGDSRSDSTQNERDQFGLNNHWQDLLKEAESDAF
ncbi:hypothetical protein Unana1_02511 [Umbelopsis nana]